MGHLIEGAVSYYEATGKDKLLHAAERFADYATDYFGPEEGKCKGYPGHEIAEMALVRLYEVTGEQKYLDLSRFFIDERGTKPYYFDKEHPETVKKGHENELRYSYYQAHLPVRQQDEAFGHAVRAVYLYSGMADIARITKDEELYQACVRLWNNVTKKKMYITGGIGATHLGEAFSFPYDLPNDTAYAETCASIGLMFWARRMLEIVPDAKYADIMERALYNGVLSGMALDGKSFFYVNPLEVLPEACHKDERKFHVKPVRQKWFGCACCPPNLVRMVTSLGKYTWDEDEDTIYSHMFIGQEAKLNKADISVKSSYPWKGQIAYTINPKTSDKFAVAIHIPGYLKKYTVRLNGEIIDASKQVKNGYMYIERVWYSNDTIEITFDMEIRKVYANTNVREDIGCVALMRGPFVYCFEGVDNDSDVQSLILEAEKIDQAKKEIMTDDLLKGMTSILVPAVRLESDDGLYSENPPKERSVMARAVPYFAWGNRGLNQMRVWMHSR